MLPTTFCGGMLSHNVFLEQNQCLDHNFKYNNGNALACASCMGHACHSVSSLHAVGMVFRTCMFSEHL